MPENAFPYIGPPLPGRFRLRLRAANNYDEELTLQDVVKDSRSRVSYISKEKAFASKGQLYTFRSSTKPCYGILTLYFWGRNRALPQMETFIVIDSCPGGHDAIFRHNFIFENEDGVVTPSDRIRIKFEENDSDQMQDMYSNTSQILVKSEVEEWKYVSVKPHFKLDPSANPRSSVERILETNARGTDELQQHVVPRLTDEPVYTAQDRRTDELRDVKPEGWSRSPADRRLLRSS